MSSALNIGLSTGNVGIGNRSYNDRVVPVSDGRINGVNITELNRRTRASKASAEAAVSSWVTRASAADNDWRSSVWAPELSIFVAVARTGTGNRVMTSPDSITWTTRASAADNEWYSVVWAPELSLFVAIAQSGTGNRVMTSSDGIIWTTRISAADNEWNSLCWAPELSIFVAVGRSGTGNRIMTSINGILWTTRTSPADNLWNSVCWAPELSILVAVASSTTGNRVMTSYDGITWITRSTPVNNDWRFVCWSPELSIFAAASNTGSNRIMTSPDGIVWTTQTTTTLNTWWFICWAPELSIFVTVANSGTGNRVMTSSDGITWTTRSSAADINWISVCFAPELSIFLALSNSGTGNRVMTSAIGMPNSKSVVKALPSQVTVDANGNVGIGTTVPTAKLHVNGTCILQDQIVLRNSTTWSVYQTVSTASDRSAIYQSIPFNTITSTNPIWSIGCKFNLNSTFSIWPYDGTTHKDNVLTIKPEGYVGINTSSPLCAFDVRTPSYAGFAVSGGYYFNNGTGTLTAFGSGTATNATIRADNHIYAVGFSAYSDARIKKNITSLNNGIEYLRNIEPKSYNYIDYIKNTSNVKYGFIAQQIKKVLPTSVFTQKEFIPSIFKLANVSSDNILHFKSAHDLEIGDKIKLIGMSNEEYISNVSSIIDSTSFTIDNMSFLNTMSNSSSNIFVYGKEVEDYHVLEKDDIYTIGISAIIDLDRQVEHLKAENIHLKLRLDAIDDILKHF